MSDSIDAVIRQLEKDRAEREKARRNAIELDRRRARLLALIDRAGGLEVGDGELYVEFVHRWATLWIRVGRLLRLLHGPDVFKHLDLSSNLAHGICVELLERAFWKVDRVRFEEDLLKAVEGLLRAKSAMSLRWFFDLLRGELLAYWVRIREVQDRADDPAPVRAPPPPRVRAPARGGAKRLYPGHETAYRLAQWAISKNADLKDATDAGIYDWLTERGGDVPSRLPIKSTFLRYLGAARSFYGELKREQRKWGTSHSASTSSGARSEPGADESDSIG